MKLIHLSDLHLGKRFNDTTLIPDQEYVLKQVLTIIRQEQADAVLLSGDIYDKSIPSIDAVTLLDNFLHSLAQLKVTVFIISGNHDSPERLAFGGRFLELSGIHICPVYNGTIAPLQLSDSHGAVNFWLLPFVKPAHVKRYYPDAGIESYTDALRVAIEHMPMNLTARNVLLTHQFVTGAERSDSEDISVGGSDNVDASVFEAFDYVALGHIHGPQNIGSNKIRYCGTPLKYSFSEAEHFKSVTVVQLEEKGQLELHTLPLTPLHDMRKLRGSFSQLTDKTFYEGTATDDYIQVTLTDEEDVPEAMGKLRCIYPNIMELRYDNTRTRADQIIDGAEDVESKTPLQLFEDLYQQQNNQPMSPQQRSFITELMEAIWKETP